jgi:hypothetical protein
MPGALSASSQEADRWELAAKGALRRMGNLLRTALIADSQFSYGVQNRFYGGKFIQNFVGARARGSLRSGRVQVGAQD